MKIYLASSWRNEEQQNVVKALRAAGHTVYDFKNPKPGDTGFHWSSIDPNWKSWTAEQFAKGLEHPVAESGFTSDMDALRACDACVLLLPCGKSAHLELGYAVGANKLTIVMFNSASSKEEPELMYMMCDYICLNIEEVLAKLEEEK